MNMRMSEPQFGQLVAPGGSEWPQLEHSRTNSPALVSRCVRLERTRPAMSEIIATITTTAAINQMAVVMLTIRPGKVSRFAAVR